MPSNSGFSKLGDRETGVFERVLCPCCGKCAEGEGMPLRAAVKFVGLGKRRALDNCHSSGLPQQNDSDTVTHSPARTHTRTMRNSMHMPLSHMPAPVMSPARALYMDC